jgi:hypothetical protein
VLISVHVDLASHFADHMSDGSGARAAIDEYLDALQVPPTIGPAVMAFALERIGRNRLPLLLRAAPWQLAEAPWNDHQSRKEQDDVDQTDAYAGHQSLA